MKKNKRAFTLIELLVVVLIIGILAAVAVPQYQYAVDKSRLAAMIPLVTSLAHAKQVYYLANGTPARQFDELDVDLPGGTVIENNDYYGQTARLPKNFFISLDSALDHSILGILYFKDGSRVLYYIGTIPNNDYIQCIGTTSKQAEKLCQTLPGAVYKGKDDSRGTSIYDIR